MVAEERYREGYSRWDSVELLKHVMNHGDTLLCPAAQRKQCDLEGSCVKSLYHSSQRDLAKCKRFRVVTKVSVEEAPGHAKIL